MKMQTEERRAQAMQDVLEMFASGVMPEAIAHSKLEIPEAFPCSRWKGLTNRVLWYLYTSLQDRSIDARTFKQWKTVGRFPKKDSGFYLWRPKLVPREDIEDPGAEGFMVIGFSPFCVHSYTDTSGAEIEELTFEPKEAPPLIEVAEKMGVAVSYKPTSHSIGWGSYSPNQENISLATHDEEVFFHELAHHVHKLVLKEREVELQSGQVALQEITAELAAAVLCRLVGRATAENGFSFKYISGYAERAGLDPLEACKLVLDDVEQILTKIEEAS